MDGAHNPSATTLNRLVPLVTCSGKPKRSSAGSVMDERLVARVLTKPPRKPSVARRSPSKPAGTPISSVSRGYCTLARGASVTTGRFVVQSMSR
jgi:hypothetical protein